MIYTCVHSGCGFTAFNEKALVLHVAEKHTPKPKTEKKNGNGEAKLQEARSVKEPSEKIEKKQEKHDEKPRGPNFISRFLNKTVTIQSLDGGQLVSGKLTGYNQYELVLEDGKGRQTLLWKHALFSMTEVG